MPGWKASQALDFGLWLQPFPGRGPEARCPKPGRLISCYRRFSMSSAREQLLRLLAARSFRLGEFKLSSGAISDYYIDCRTTTLDAKGAKLTGQVFLDEIRARGWRPHAIGGLTMGADPIVSAVSVVSGDINGFLVRKAEKEHGTGQRVEGFREKGARVVIVDD